MRTALVQSCWIALLVSAASLDVRAEERKWPFPSRTAGATAAFPIETDVEIGPNYIDAPELKAKAEVPKGKIHEFTMNSADSKIFPGLTGAYTRRVQVYVPQQKVASKPLPIIIVQDGTGYTDRLATVLDNLIAERRLPVMAAVMIDSGGGDGKGSERGLEYDTVSDRYVTFIETEVLPRVARECSITFTRDPQGRASMGGSSGAACAFTMAWFRPDLYRRVLSYSGTYVNQQSPEDPKLPHGAWEYHERLIRKTPPKPIRFWLHVSEHDNGSTQPEETLHNWVLANIRMAAELKSKGYAYRYVYAKNAGHVDGKVVGQTLPEALLWLWSGHPIQ